jgi:hypothetical protein
MAKAFFRTNQLVTHVRQILTAPVRAFPACEQVHHPFLGSEIRCAARDAFQLDACAHRTGETRCDYLRHEWAIQPT